MKRYVYFLFLSLVGMGTAYPQTPQHDMSHMDMKGMNMGKKKTVKPAPKTITHKTGSKKNVVKKVAKTPAIKKTASHSPAGSMDMKEMNMGHSHSPAKKDTVKMDANMPGMDHSLMHGLDTVPKGTPATQMDHNQMDHRQMGVTKDSVHQGMAGMGDTSKKPVQMDHSGMLHEMKGTDTMPKKHMDMTHDQAAMHAMSGMEGMNEMGGMGSMSHAFSLNLPMNRNGSGTGWLPDNSPMYGYMFHQNDWMFMLHGNLFLRYNNQDFSKKGSRGGHEVDAPDWLMFMGQRKVGSSGLFHFSTMLSLDAPLGGADGYPLLFQSGEAYQGKAVVDRQHPHDLFSELSVSYTQALSPKADVFLYVAYPGEPALGPVAFMHRPSALNNPDAPLSHHWSDATHISFGVATLGVRLGAVKLEGSSFTGREPDENRYNFDKPLFNSWSGRLSWNPEPNWALQVSHGFIKSPESLHPLEDIHRTTASVVYSKVLRANSTFNTTLVWGQNKTAGKRGEKAVLLETEWRKNKLALHGRYEWVQKSTEELALDELVYGADAVFPVNAFTGGFNYDLLQSGKTRFALGSQISFYHSVAKLDALYGRNPMSFEIYLRIYPALMSMKH